MNSSSVSNGRVSSNLIITQALIGVTKIELEMEDEHHDSSDDHGSRTGSDDNSGDDTDDDSGVISTVGTVETVCQFGRN